MTDEQRIQRGYRASHLINSEAFPECIAELNRLLHGAIETFPDDNPDKVMPIVRQLRAIRAIETKLASWAADGERLSRQK